MRCCFYLIATLLLAAPVWAMDPSDIPPSPIVKTQLVVDMSQASRTGAAAVVFTMPPEWHIYWKNPGDSGLPTKLEWTLPQGVTAGDIEWPAPKRIVTDTLVNYGYGDQVALPVALNGVRPGTVGEIKVKASWLVCKDICIPEKAELTAMLNGNEEAGKIIADARALVPQKFDGSASFDGLNNQVTLVIRRANPWGMGSDMRFSPLEDGILANYPAGEVKQVGNELHFTMPRGTGDMINTLHGVLQVTQDGKQLAWNIAAVNRLPVATKPGANDAAQPATTTPAPAPAPIPSSLITALALAFLGGLILNIMPCVLPILALKALALSKKAAVSQRAAIRQGVSYTGGVIASFLLIAGVMLALKATGSAIGWGFQLQNPAFVAFLVIVMLGVTANLLGLFELPVLFGEKATGVDDSNLRGSFLTGVLAVLVATPCTAPFMATAIGATLAFPTVQALAVFAALGLGMAAPFLLISFWPAARRLLPRPGAWMHKFKLFLAIPMLATALWLMWVLVQLIHPTPLVLEDGHVAYSAPRLAQLRAEGKPVLVDATAAWCLSCKVNERVALQPEGMQQFFKEKNVTIMVADWTNSDPAITKYLAEFGRNGVPLYVYYAPHAEPNVLPQVLTPSIVRGAIDPGRD
ncbi:MAG: protein-disulfide reductase DsbD family protein [Rickettsiales bacterium]